MTKALTISALLTLAFLTGCSPTPDISAGNPTGDRTLPGWVLVVPTVEDGRTLFVGGCTMALSAEEGIAAARTEALLQITSSARSRFTDVFALSPRESGVATTSIDRLDFREMGQELYPEALEGSTSVDRIYLRSCLTGESWESPGTLDGAEIEGEVCMVFVQLSLESDAWERNLSETLRDMGRTFRSSGRGNLAALADWIDGRLPEYFRGDDMHEEGTGTGSR